MRVCRLKSNALFPLWPSPDCSCGAIVLITAGISAIRRCACELRCGVRLQCEDVSDLDKVFGDVPHEPYIATNRPAIKLTCPAYLRDQIALIPAWPTRSPQPSLKVECGCFERSRCFNCSNVFLLLSMYANTISIRCICKHVFSKRELFAICRRPSVCLSVCRLSVTFVHPTQMIEIFGNVSTPFGTKLGDLEWPWTA